LGRKLAFLSVHAREKFYIYPKLLNSSSAMGLMGLGGILG